MTNSEIQKSIQGLIANQKKKNVLLNEKEKLYKKREGSLPSSQIEFMNNQILALDKKFVLDYDNLKNMTDINELGELSKIFNPILKELKILVKENQLLLMNLEQEENKIYEKQKLHLNKTTNSDFKVNQKKIKAYKKF